MEKAWLIGTLILMLLLGLWLARPSRSVSPPQPSPAGEPEAIALPMVDETAVGSGILKDYASDRSDGRGDVQLMERLLGSYFMLVKGDAPLPLASNATIAAAFRGENRSRMALLPHDHHAFDAEGAFVDRWGTPLFFHAEAADHVEVRSAGPDQQMWTDDDLVSGERGVGESVER